MALYEITDDALNEVRSSTFADKQIKEREDLQRLLKNKIEVLDPELLIIAEEFGDWDESCRRIDLLALDSKANLVVIELKRTQDGGHMDLQSLRYAAMISTMTFEQACRTYDRYLKDNGSDEDAEQMILKHLEWDEGDDEIFGQDVRLILASADFSKEITTTVMWLNERELDIRCFRLTPHDLDGRTLLDVQQIVPLPEAKDFIVGVGKKSQAGRADRAQRQKWNLGRLLAAIKTNAGEQCVRTAGEIHDWSEEVFGRITWSEAKVDGSFIPVWDGNHENHWFFALRSTGKIELYLGIMAKKPPFDDLELRKEFLKRMNAFGADVPDDKLEHYPKFSLDLLENENKMAEFQNVILWALDRAKQVEL